MAGKFFNAKARRPQRHKREERAPAEVTRESTRTKHEEPISFHAQRREGRKGKTKEPRTYTNEHEHEQQHTTDDQTSTINHESHLPNDKTGQKGPMGESAGDDERA